MRDSTFIKYISVKFQFHHDDSERERVPIDDTESSHLLRIETPSATSVHCASLKTKLNSKCYKKIMNNVWT